VVSSTEYVFAPTTTWSSTTSSGAITGFDATQLYSAGLTQGMTAYMIAYGESAKSNSYVDPSLGKSVYPNVNTAAPSNVVQFIVP
jgi:hypothetical protein